MVDSYDHNGLISSILPNAYINRITLEGANAALNKLAANRESAIEAHIEPRISPGQGMEFSGWTGDPTEDKYIDQSKLKVTYDLFAEIPQGSSILEMALQDSFANDPDNSYVDIFQFIKIRVITFKGNEAVKFYRHLIGESVDNNKYANNLFIENILGGSWLGQNTNLDYNIDFTITEAPIFDPNSNTSIVPANDAGDDPQNYSGKGLDYYKQKFKHQMPDGSIVYKLPVRLSQELSGPDCPFPNELAAIATCVLDTDSIIEQFPFYYHPGATKTFTDAINEITKFGRHATELIIRGGNVVKKGMIFFISTDQEHEPHINAFKHLEGQLWFGGVHKAGDRFMAGNKHTSKLHPYLDYVLVDNNRVVDFRQIALIKKQMFNMQSSSDEVFGGNYINLQTKVGTADFGELSCFSNLISSVNTDRRIKLYFCIDWGKLIKRYSAMPRLLDMLANTPVELRSFLDTTRPISFKIYRKRQDISHDVVNQTGRELVYDGYPSIYYFGNQTFLDTKGELLPPENWPNPISALAPVNIDYGPGPGTSPTKWADDIGMLKHYTFTDNDIQKISKGVFEYSLEIEIYDPTLQYLVTHYQTIKKGLSDLKLYVRLANGTSNTLGKGVINYFNPYTGVFDNAFLQEAHNLGYNVSLDSGALQLPNLVDNAIQSVIKMIFLFRKDANYPFSLLDNFKSMLNPTTTTPDAIGAVYDMVNTVATNLRKLINSFTTKKIPKTDTAKGPDGKIELIFTKSTAGTSEIPKRKIEIIHNFDDLSEHVNTIYADAGYEFTGPDDLPNISSKSIGLKSIFREHYIAYSNLEINNYFKDAENLTLSLPFAPSTAPGSVQLANPISVHETAGRYLRVPSGYTHLPNSIVHKYNENDYWMVINNILRYKHNLLGNPTNADAKTGMDLSDFNNFKSALGYGLDDKIPGSAFIAPQMERILKEYQTLSHNGVYFAHFEDVPGDDPIVSTKTIEGSDKVSVWQKSDSNDDSSGAQDGTAESWDNNNDPVPDNASAANEDKDNEQKKAAWTKIPWAKNVGQEQFLLSLVVSNYLNPNIFNLKLGSFNPLLLKAAIHMSYNNFAIRYYDYYKKFYWADLGPAGGNKKVIIRNIIRDHYYRTLPYQTIALILNHTENRVSLNSNFSYYPVNLTSTASEALYLETPMIPGTSLEQVINDKNMSIDKFGQFWFNHQNLGEVEYLNGYKYSVPLPKKVVADTTLNTEGEKVTKKYPFADQIDLGTKFEDISTHCVKAPDWRPLSINLLNSWTPAFHGHLLCRIKKYRDPMFSAEIYDVLDLPVYDEYFFINVEQDAQINAYTDAKAAPSELGGPIMGTLTTEDPGPLEKIGICCLSNGACFETTEEQCFLAGGTFTEESEAGTGWTPPPQWIPPPPTADMPENPDD